MAFSVMAETWGTMETVTDFIFLGSKITADSDCSHEIKRCLLLGIKVMANLDSSTLAWKIPWMEEPCGLLSMGLHRVGHDWSDLAAAAADSILKSRDVTLPTKVHLVKLWFFQWSCTAMRGGLWRRLSAEESMLLNCGVGEDSWESLGLQGDPTSPFWRRSVLNIHWKAWCWSWNSSSLATW